MRVSAFLVIAQHELNCHYIRQVSIGGHKTSAYRLSRELLVHEEAAGHPELDNSQPVDVRQGDPQALTCVWSFYILGEGLIWSASTLSRLPRNPGETGAIFGAERGSLFSAR